MGLEHILCSPTVILFWGFDREKVLTDNIIQFPKHNALVEDAELDPKEMLGVLQEEVKMTEAIVVGWTDDGNLFMATSHGRAPDMVFLLELAKSVLLNRCVGDE